MAGKSRFWPLGVGGLLAVAVALAFWYRRPNDERFEPRDDYVSSVDAAWAGGVRPGAECARPTGGAAAMRSEDEAASRGVAGADVKDGAAEAPVMANAAASVAGVAAVKPAAERIRHERRGAGVRRGEAAVRRFNGLVDTWVCKREVTSEAVGEFVQAVREIPVGMRLGPVRRALNLIPDDNAELLTGLLLDDEQPPEVMQAVFDELVSRPEAVSEKALGELVERPTHPYSDDATWIFKVTGENIGGGDEGE